jgi:hypothetical protein
VVAETEDRLVLLLGPHDLANCNGSPERLADAIARAVEQHQLGWADPAPA